MHRLLFLLTCLLLSMPGVAVHDSGLADHPLPYLRSHADDSIHWRSFTDAAFASAKADGKPILISSGYSSCYWCFKMKKDTFSDKAVGETVNAGFVPVIVDRELEPEVDAWLQAFIEQQRGFGGWPLSVILTPDAMPVAGFSYTKADEFNTTLQRFLKDWAENADGIRSNAQQKADALAKQRAAEAQTQADTTRAAVLMAFLKQVSAAADDEYGGFGDGEKFPHLPQLAALFELHKLNPNGELYKFLQTSFSAMIGDSLRDHLGGGFFRYTDDRQWAYPHYEQMLYTQVLVAPLLIRVGTEFKQPTYVQTGREALLHTLQAFRREDGLFRAGLSAVGEGGTAGGGYLWTLQQLQEVLGDGWQGSVHNLLGEESAVVLPFVLTQGAKAAEIRRQLLEARSKRTITADDKALLGWNALALSAFASALELDPAIRQAGEKLAASLLALVGQDSLPRLIGEADAGEAHFADRVYLARALADWGQASKEPKFTQAAASQLRAIHARYYREGGWVQGAANPLLGTLAAPVMADTQLPSPSALWLETAWRLAVEDAELGKLADTVGAKLPNALRENAFFHATHIATLVKHAAKEQQ